MADRAQPRPARLAEQSNQPVDPNDGNQRGEHGQGLPKQTQPTGHAAELLGNVGTECKHRPTVPQLPHEVWKPQQRRYQAAEPGVRRSQLTAATRHEQHAQEYGEQQNNHCSLVVQAQPSQDTGKEPEPRPIIAQGVSDNQEHGCPGQRVEGRSTEAMTQCHGDH